MPALHHDTAPARKQLRTLALLAAALVTGCGGGGFEVLSSGSGNGGSTSISASSASSYAANATMIASDTSAALDETMLAAADAALQARTTAAPVSLRVACTATGSALVNVSGGTVGSVVNGQFDVGEVYQIVFDNCRGNANGTAVSGTLTLTVLAPATSGSLNISATASNLVVALPRGSITLNGDLTRQSSSSAGNAGSVQITSHTAASRMTAGTQLNGRNSSFTLNALDVTRNSSWQSGILLSSTLTGSHTLAATLLGIPFAHSINTDGNVGYAANGVPTAGRWVLVVPSARLVVTVTSGSVTVQVDEGNNGSVDTTFSFTISRLQGDAG